MLAKKNFAKSTLGAAIAATDTSLSVAAGDGVKFPASGNFMAVIWGAPYSSPSDDPGREVALMLLSSGDSFAVTRGQEATTASAWNAGDHIAHIVTAGTFSDFDLAGEIKMYAGPTAPSGWLFCDGSPVSRTAYANLFAAIGTVFGAGDGSTTFNLPDLRGRTPIGAGTGTGLTARALAATGGEETHVLSSGEMPSHNHAIPILSSSGTVEYVPNAVNSDTPNYIGTAMTGGGAAHNTMQPFLALHFIIRY